MRASPSKLARIRSFDLPNQTATSIRPLRFVLLAELEKLSKRKKLSWVNKAKKCFQVFGAPRRK
jgi:hypothetical protein